MKIYFHTFGCRVNQSETQWLRESLLSRGHEDASSWGEADLFVINTCTVTAEADKDCLRMLRKIQKASPAAQIVVTGCFATRDPREILKAAPGARIVSNEKKEDIPSLLGCRLVPESEVEDPRFKISGFKGHSRAFVKIQDGCNMQCSYCIIPSVRPALWSKPFEVLRSEVEDLIAQGYPEIVLCGIRLGRYLCEDEEGRRVDFTGLLSRLLELPGDFRLRLSSLEITDLTERLLNVLTDAQGKLCPYFHLPLQSGSDEVLRRMKRWYTSGFYRRRVESLRSRWPGAGLFTDVMVGFPGETRDQFDETVRFIRDLGFSGLHVFRYSSREGTPAAEDEAQTPPETLLERSRSLHDLDSRLREDFRRQALGSLRPVVLEPGLGRTEALTDHFLRLPWEGPFRAGIVSSRIVEGPDAQARAIPA